MPRGLAASPHSFRQCPGCQWVRFFHIAGTDFCSAEVSLILLDLSWHLMGYKGMWAHQFPTTSVTLVRCAGVRVEVGCRWDTADAARASCWHYWCKKDGRDGKNVRREQHFRSVRNRQGDISLQWEQRQWVGTVGWSWLEEGESCTSSGGSTVRSWEWLLGNGTGVERWNRSPVEAVGGCCSNRASLITHRHHRKSQGCHLPPFSGIWITAFPWKPWPVSRTSASCLSRKDFLENSVDFKTSCPAGRRMSC